MIAHVMDAGPASHVDRQGRLCSQYTANPQQQFEVTNASKHWVPTNAAHHRVADTSGSRTSAAAPRTHDIAKSSHYSGTLPAAITRHRHERMTRATHLRQLQSESRATAFHNGRLERCQQGAPLATPLQKSAYVAQSCSVEASGAQRPQQMFSRAWTSCVAVASGEGTQVRKSNKVCGQHTSPRR